MLYSIIMPVVVFLLALGASYFITRPIGDRRRQVAARDFERRPGHHRRLLGGEHGGRDLL